MVKDEGDVKRQAQEDSEKRWEMAFAARITEIVPGLLLGNVEASYKRDMLQENRINAIVSLTDARWVWWSSATRNAGIPQERHKWVQCVDSSTQDLLFHMNDICDFLDQMASPPLQSSSALPVDTTNTYDQRPDGILIHCDLGISRSPTIIIAYLMRKYHARQEDVLAFVCSKQRVKPSANFARQLRIWQEVGYQVWEDEERTIPKAPYQEFLDDRRDILRQRGLTGNEPLAPQEL